MVPGGSAMSKKAKAVRLLNRLRETAAGDPLSAVACAIALLLFLGSLLLRYFSAPVQPPALAAAWVAGVLAFAFAAHRHFSRSEPEEDVRKGKGFNAIRRFSEIEQLARDFERYVGRRAEEHSAEALEAARKASAGLRERMSSLREEWSSSASEEFEIDLDKLSGGRLGRLQGELQENFERMKKVVREATAERTASLAGVGSGAEKLLQGDLEKATKQIETNRNQMKSMGDMASNDRASKETESKKLQGSLDALAVKVRAWNRDRDELRQEKVRYLASDEHLRDRAQAGAVVGRFLRLVKAKDFEAASSLVSPAGGIDLPAVCDRMFHFGAMHEIERSAVKQVEVGSDSARVTADVLIIDPRNYSSQSAVSHLLERRSEGWRIFRIETAKSSVS